MKSHEDAIGDIVETIDGFAARKPQNQCQTRRVRLAPFEFLLPANARAA